MLRRCVPSLAGISAMNVFVPPARVDLEKWCQWTGNDFSKIQEVVGKSFRVCAPNENAYTMAATAVLRLIVENNIDPTQVGQLSLGTESSTDNSAGSVIVRGMVDRALTQHLGLPPLSRNMEVQEVKHACLGGMYALLNATRYAQTDGQDRLAIVVASDIAAYESKTSGEVTGGAGAVAMLVERRAKLLDLDLSKRGCASAYRGPDFRKPHRRHFIDNWHTAGSTEWQTVKDTPVFSGGYSTACYTDEVVHAVEDMLSKMHLRKAEAFDNASAVFAHRPYQQMPVQAMSFLWARALARAVSPEHVAAFEKICATAKVAPADVLSEISASTSSTSFFDSLEATGKTPSAGKATEAVAKALRRDADFMKLIDAKMNLGQDLVKHLGNLYTASLPAWCACGLEDAQAKGRHLAGHPMILIGYGSGDASEAIPATPVGGWEHAASKIGVRKLLDAPTLELTNEQYDGLTSGKLREDICADKRSMSFVIDRIGEKNTPSFQDLGIEYYRYVK